MQVAIKQGDAGCRTVRGSQHRRPAQFKKSICRRIPCQSGKLTVKMQIGLRFAVSGTKEVESEKAPNKLNALLGRAAFMKTKTGSYLFIHSRYSDWTFGRPHFFGRLQCPQEKGHLILIHPNVSPPSYKGTSSNPPHSAELGEKASSDHLCTSCCWNATTFWYLSSDHTSVFCGLMCAVARNRSPFLFQNLALFSFGSWVKVDSEIPRSERQREQTRRCIIIFKKFLSCLYLDLLKHYSQRIVLLQRILGDCNFCL